MYAFLVYISDMNEDIKFTGRKYSETELSSYRETIRKENEKGVIRIDGEDEKTPEENEYVIMANTIIDVWCKKMGVPFESTPAERIHFLSPEVSKTYLADQKTVGQYSHRFDWIIIRKNSDMRPAELLSVLVHEMLHRLHMASSTWHVSDDGGFSKSRSGYNLHSPWREDIPRLKGLDEIVIVHCQRNILEMAQDFIDEQLHIPPSEWASPDNYQYKKHLPILKAIIDGVSVKSPASEFSSFEKVVRGQFGKTLLNLKDVDYVFGARSIRILSYLMAFEGTEGEEIDDLIHAYFLEQSDSKRKEIGAEITFRAKQVSLKEGLVLR